MDGPTISYANYYLYTNHKPKNSDTYSIACVGQGPRRNSVALTILYSVHHICSNYSLDTKILKHDHYTVCTVIGIDRMQNFVPDRIQDPDTIISPDPDTG